MSRTPVPIGLVGLGKICRDQHLPAVAGSDAFELAAVCTLAGEAEGVPTFRSLEAMLEGAPQIAAVSLCTPPVGRYALASQALALGRHVLLEKPPAATLGEIDALAAQAAAAGLTLFATWHSRHAPAVEAARAWVADHPLAQVRIDWREDVRHWHPGQAWIWRPGGLGVFDPGINALSILTHILPQPVFVEAARLSFPANRATPIAADLAMVSAEGVPIEAGFDWRQTGEQTWDIRLEARSGETLRLSHGGARLEIDGRAVEVGPEAEYAGVYARFAQLIAGGERDVDVSPQRIVADALLLGERLTVEAFED